MAMRDVMQGDEDNPKVPMENNCRLQMPTNNRVVRTNINFRSPVGLCQTSNLHVNLSDGFRHIGYTNDAIQSQVVNVRLKLTEA